MKNNIITIVGVGLLGGSYAMGLSRAGNTVYGIDILKESIDFAKEHGYISDGGIDDYSDFLAKSDLIVLCLYPNSAAKWVEKHAHMMNKNAIVTDVCGVKRGVVNKIQTILEPYGIEFYSSHPMRGKEVLGVKHADCAIFRDANMILVPTDKNTKRGEKTVTSMAYTLGFTEISTLTPEEHDKVIGYLSQLTHAIAVSLMTSNDNDVLERYSGDSFIDLTRIAKIDEQLWSELFSHNKDILCEEIDDFISNLTKLRNYVDTDDIDGLKEMFRRSTKRRKMFDK